MAVIFKELPLAWRNTRLFYEQKLAPVPAPSIVNVAEPIPVVANGEQAVALPFFIHFKTCNYH